MNADALVFLLAAVLVAVAQVLVVVTFRPRPRRALEIIYLVLPAVGLAVLLVFAWRAL